MAQHFTWPKLLRFVAPSIAMVIFTSLYGIVDGLFVSNFAGKTAFAAVNLIIPPVMILSTTGFMLGAGGSALVAKTLGHGDDALANRYFSMIVYGGAVIGVVLAVLGAVFMEPIAYALGADGEMLPICVLYGRMLMLSLPLYTLQFAFQNLFVTAAKPQLGFIVILVAGVANMVLDALFVGLLGWGVAGAAAATNVSEFLGGGLPLIYFLRANDSQLRLVRTRFEWGPFGRACLNGLSEMMTSIAMSVVSILYNFQLMAMVGEDGVATYGIIMYVVMVFAAIFMGYDVGFAPLLSYQYGAGDRVEMRSLLRKSLVFVTVGGVAMFACGQLFAGAVADVFVGYDANLRAMTEHGFKLYALAFLLMGFSMYGSAFFTALNNGVVSAVISFLRTLVFEVASVLLMPMVLGLDGIWLSSSVAEVGALVVTVTFMVALGPHYGYRTPLAEKRAKKGTGGSEEPKGPEGS